MEGPPLSPPPPPPTDEPPGDDHYSGGASAAAAAGCYSLPADMSSYSPGSPPPPLVNQQGQVVTAAAVGQPQVVQVSPLVNAVAPTLSSTSAGAPATAAGGGGGAVGTDLPDQYQQNNLPLLRAQLKVQRDLVVLKTLDTFFKKSIKFIFDTSDGDA